MSSSNFNLIWTSQCLGRAEFEKVQKNIVNYGLYSSDSGVAQFILAEQGANTNKARVHAGDGFAEYKLNKDICVSTLGENVIEISSIQVSSNSRML